MATTTIHPLDYFPIGILYLLTAALLFLGIELGIRLGRYRKQYVKNESPKDIALLAGATLTLLAFMLVYQLGTADQRYDNRRRLAVADANAIGTAYLRAGYLEEPIRSASRDLYRRYVDDRLALVEDEITLEEGEARSAETQADLWSMAEDLARAHPESEVVSIYIQALNHMIDLHAERSVAVLARLPYPSLIALFVLAFLTMVIIGYNIGLTGEHNLIAFIGLALVFAAVITLIIDLDRPLQGLFQVSQKAMIDLQAMMAASSP